MEQSELEYKLVLATDLAYFLMNVLLRPIDNKIEMTNLIIDKWVARTTKQLDEVVRSQVVEYAEMTGDDPDVASILCSIHQLDDRLIRKEFAENLRGLFTATMIKEMKGMETKK